jgi:nucleoid-associated protein YgaU
MDTRRFTGLLALFLLGVLIAGLVAYDIELNRSEPQTAFAPAESANESVPVPDALPPVADKAPAAGQPDTTVAAVDPKVMVPPTSSPPVAALETPSFDVVRVEPTGEAVIAGQAEPQAKVEVLDGVAAIATAEANERGEWAIALEKPLSPGTHDLGIRMTEKDKPEPKLSEQRVTVSVPQQGSKDVLVVLNTPDAASKILAVPGATEGTTPPAVVTVPAPPPMAAAPPAAAEPRIAAEAPIAAEPPIKLEPKIAAAPEPPKAPAPEVTVAAVEADTGGALFIAGTAATRDTVRIYIDDKPIGEAQPSPSGTWLVETERDLPAGNYTVRADQVDAQGQVLARSEVPFEREIDVAILKPTGSAGAGARGAPAAATASLSGEMPAMETVIIKRGDNLWRIARGAWGKGVRWSTIYQANTDQIRDPHWIYPGQVFVMPKGNVTWTD